ncbi:hypothetical protein GCM10010449_29560 [Streptomyces rectiviolaceus]|uniref:Uncharacterized protein n=1 Tax=Streptomyces rectiviolaceus TaxID=332591 RepID=A0ABN3YDU2_9ACTN
MGGSVGPSEFARFDPGSPELQQGLALAGAGRNDVTYYPGTQDAPGQTAHRGRVALCGRPEGSTTVVSM